MYVRVFYKKTEPPLEKLLYDANPTVCCTCQNRDFLAQRTHSEFPPENGPLPQCRAVPAAVSELELTLVDPHLNSFSDHYERIGSALTDSPLTGGQAGDFIADDARTQCNHRRQTPGKGEGETVKCGTFSPWRLGSP